MAILSPGEPETDETCSAWPTTGRPASAKARLARQSVKRFLCHTTALQSHNLVGITSLQCMSTIGHATSHRRRRDGVTWLHGVLLAISLCPNEQEEQRRQHNEGD